MTRLGRRAVLSGAAALFAGLCGSDGEALADVAASGVFGALPSSRNTLWLRRPNGLEIMSTYRSETDYDRFQVLQLSWFMRDLVDGDHAVWMAPRLFDLLSAVQTGLSTAKGSRVPLIVTSGYRTAEHNARIESAARNSMHLYGYAADLKAPGFSPQAIALAASFFNHGGIGLYESFTHLDVWKARHWFGPPARTIHPGTAVAAQAPAR